MVEHHTRLLQQSLAGLHDAAADVETLCMSLPSHGSSVKEVVGGLVSELLALEASLGLLTAEVNGSPQVVHGGHAP